MDANTKRIMHIRVKNTIKNLEANNMKAVYVETKEEALTLVKSIVEKGAYTATGGSMTLRECGIYQYLETETDLHTDAREAYEASYFLLSANYRHTVFVFYFATIQSFTKSLADYNTFFCLQNYTFSLNLPRENIYQRLF